MKTPDSVSKTKQRLFQEIELWKQREMVLMSPIILTDLPEAEEIKKKIDFCRQEADKCKKEINKLVYANRTPRQVRAGWK